MTNEHDEHDDRLAASPTSTIATTFANRRTLLIVSLTLAALTVAGFAYATSRQTDEPSPRSSTPTTDTGFAASIALNNDTVGDALPDVTITDVDGRPVRTTSISGRATVINFWYSSCPPCRQEIPAFSAVATELGNTVRFVGINPVDSADAARDFAEELGMRYDNLLDPDGELIAQIGIATFPTTLFVRADGTIAAQHAGAMTADQLRTTINDNLLAG